MALLTSCVVALFLTLVPVAEAVIAATTEESCHNQLGRWVTVVMKDSGIPANGWEGNYLHFQNDELEDMHTFTLGDGLSYGTESFCLDTFGDEFSKCYTIYMDEQGYNPQQVSWSLEVSTKNSGAAWRTEDGVDEWVSGDHNKEHGYDAATDTMKAIKEGGAPADVKIMCGRLFKKLGRYSLKQIDKVGIDHMSNEDNMLYKSQSAMEKIESRAQQLKLYAVNSAETPSLVDRDDWAADDATTTTGASTESTSEAPTTSTMDDACDGCGPSCTGCAVKSWQGDGQCDDDNNSCGCNWDGGDCCGDDAQTLYCTDCFCLDPDEARRALRGA